MPLLPGDRNATVRQWYPQRSPNVRRGITEAVAVDRAHEPILRIFGPWVAKKAATPMANDDCVGNYEYMPDGSWKGTGTCNVTFKGGGKLYESWEEGSHLKEYSFKSPVAPANTNAPAAAARTRLTT